MQEFGQRSIDRRSILFTATRILCTGFRLISNLPITMNFWSNWFFLKSPLTSMKKIVLASISPRRKEILLKLRIPFEVKASNYEEDMSLDLSPEDLAKTL